MHQSRFRIYIQMTFGMPGKIGSDTAVHLLYLGNTYLQCFQLV